MKTKPAVLLSLLSLLTITVNANGDNPIQTIGSSMCQDFDLNMIPLVDHFVPIASVPLDKGSKFQDYNTPYNDGYCGCKGHGDNYCSCDHLENSKECAKLPDIDCSVLGGQWVYGHSGVDIVTDLHSDDGNDIKAIQKGFVVLSLSELDSKGWGETIVLATRPNFFSDEIITHHYHHMLINKATKTSPPTITRKFNACETVSSAGTVIGKEGMSGNATGPHLHLGVRRWNNIAELKAAVHEGFSSVLGAGYVLNDKTKLAKNLNPLEILNDDFLDYHTDSHGHQPSYAESKEFAMAMRHRGIDFGLFDGRYGAGEDVIRKDAVRWLKIAARRLDNRPSTPTFADMPKDDSDYPYVEELAAFPHSKPVIEGTVGTDGLRYFRPMDKINRAEALKMVILTFYSGEFSKVYGDDIWRADKASALQLLGQFQDVDPNKWYASYVYFGKEKGLVKGQTSFNPTGYVQRQDMAKWVVKGAQIADQQFEGPCSFLLCAAGYACEPASQQCYALPSCIPDENHTCEPGGGNGGGTGNSCEDSPECTTGETTTQGCTSNGQSGTQTRTCSDACLWGIWQTCSLDGVCAVNQTIGCGNCGTQTCDSNGNWGTCQNQGICNPGDTNLVTCNGTGTQSQLCQSDCTWGSLSTCSNTPMCNSGQTETQSCTSGGQSGNETRTCDSNGQWGSWGSCIVQCQDVFLASSSQACFTTSGGPTLCLNVQQGSNGWEYQVCKQPSTQTFSNNYKVVLRDDAHSEILDTYFGDSGTNCTPSHTFVVSSISGYGVSNAAGVRADILSPSTCTQSSCTYSSGTVTIRKECQ